MVETWAKEIARLWNECRVEVSSCSMSLKIFEAEMETKGEIW